MWLNDTPNLLYRSTWKKGRTSHAFVAMQKGNHTIFVDPQSGSKVNIQKYLSRAKLRNIQISRIDNLKPVKHIERCYIKKVK